MNKTTGKYTSKFDGSVNWVAYTPKDYNTSTKYPLIINFTGAEEKGWDIAKLNNNGLVKAIMGGLEIPFIVFTPQTPFADYDTVGPDNKFLPGQFAAEAFSIAISKFLVDSTRVYIIGLSLSGASVDNALAYYPAVFAAGINISSWPTRYEEAGKIKGAIWHVKGNGDKEAGAPYSNIEFIDRVKKAGQAKEAKYSILNVPGHDAWTPVVTSFKGVSLDPAYTGSAPLIDPFTWLLKFSTAVEPPIATQLDTDFVVTTSKEIVLGGITYILTTTTTIHNKNSILV